MDNKFEPKIVIDPFSLLVVNARGELRRIYCPFLVKCIVPIDNLVVNQIYSVDMVRTELKEHIYFSLKGKSYLHLRFEILIS
ncbi:hypothetical protein [Emticicia agri]|uniref:Uncharacterized protein n=1 Tax=Emticicia agri TaxID=2492393 RepID=A0A4Q5LQN8_9BACT|nr:hypothetical protein [Emticicia agri]RYU91801.1 hypothetical protein EWM59_26685 [Emticicia agri]